ncbi:SEC-C metal-binding domain-containing protein [Massilia sp. NP310]|uniref:SEC-C metal-binding domain-containing protein n=1 Tax=Massilia sp. NP310 TaxID=2861282 RepID=UPI001E289743|nr:SEC-C metal-binding domain-containing protein [Massilia sp. NP310]
MGEIADGTFRVMGETVRRLTDGLSIPEILRLKRVIEVARQDHADIESVATEIATTPELAAFATWMRNYFTPKSGGDLFGYLSFLLSVIGLILAMQPLLSDPPPQQLTQAQVRQITMQAMRDTFAEAQRNSSKVSKTEQVRRKKCKVGRNDPCPCMSGKKHKKCCI